jgi:hypothetical protein
VWSPAPSPALSAGLLALERGGNEAAAYSDVFDRWRDLSVPFDLALAQLDFVTLAPDHPEARAAAAEAEETFTRLRAKPFLDRLQAATPGRAVPAIEG